MADLDDIFNDLGIGGADATPTSFKPVNPSTFQPPPVSTSHPSTQPPPSAMGVQNTQPPMQFNPIQGPRMDFNTSPNAPVGQNPAGDLGMDSLMGSLNMETTKMPDNTSILMGGPQTHPPSNTQYQSPSFGAQSHFGQMHPGVMPHMMGQGGMPGMNMQMGGAPSMGLPGMNMGTPQGGQPCGGCGQPVIGQSIRACGKVWHPQHFVCGKCHNPFPNGQYLEANGVAYCEADYHAQFSSRCAKCDQPIQGKCVNALNRKWHPEHFVCTICNSSLAGTPFVDRGGQPHCKLCAVKAKPVSGEGELCGKCKKPLTDDFITVGGLKCHPEHFTCTECHTPFAAGIKCFEFESKLYCEKDYTALMNTCCANCKKPITGNCVSTQGRQYHHDCFVCFDCKKPFKGSSFYQKDGRPYCEEHYQINFGSQCAKCGKPIAGRGVKALGKQFHPEHFSCVACDKPLAGGSFCEWDGKPMCKKCFLKLPPEIRKKLAKKADKEKKKK
eukprot:TRINITY_DN2570_c0_g1_i2.p1 TRINITY_DN2570_c0_g1~~TRINITY_DN2570_c0_g1_i2.p1  ORF type:complete len:497 (-),score=47.71 TRINITY_DN2570_c0_g1_i2:31-1521(-)